MKKTQIKKEYPECDNVKFPNFNNSEIGSEVIGFFTKETLLQDISKCKDCIMELINKLDLIFDLSNLNIANQLSNAFKENKLNIIQIRLCYHFFYRKIHTLYLHLLNFSFDDYITISHNELLQKFITEKNNTIFTLDIELLTKIYFSYVEKEIKFITMIRSFGVNHQTSPTVFNIVTKFLLGIIKDTIKLTNNIINIKNFEQISDENLLLFLFNLHKLEICSQLYHIYYRIKEGIIWDEPETSPKWKLIKTHFKQIIPYSNFQINKMLSKVVEFVNVGYASISKSFEEEKNNIAKKAKAGLYMAIYFFMKNKAQTQSMKFLINPNPEISQTIWNLLDTKGFKSAIKVIIPHITYSKKWYIKKIKEEITIKEIDDLITEINSTNYQIKKKEITNKRSEMIIEKGEVDEDEVDELIKEKLKVKDKENKKKNYVKIKLLHVDNFIISSKNVFNILINNCCIPKVNKTRNSIIIHIHGGGFVAMSPSSHESYTRKWVNALCVPLISIDYSLSPQFPFPKALDDIYQVYMWIIEYGERIFQIKINNIILIGDSAGGNLALSLAYILIVKNAKLPNAIFLAYPALKLNMNELSLSYLNSLTDPILEYSLLMFCLRSYSGNCDEYNPFLSPLFMNDKVMRMLPPVRIFGGSSDPLRDDSVLLLEKLVYLGVDVEMKEIKYFPHGFLNYDLPAMMPEAGIANELIIEEMEKFISVA